MVIESKSGEYHFGTVYLDVNKNGSFEFAEPLLPNVWVKTGKDTIRTKGVFTLSGGFNLAVDTGRYITRVVLPPGLPFEASPASDAFTFAGFNNKRTVSFGVKTTANIYDAELDVSPLTLARVNRPVYYKINYRNVGSNSIGNHAIKMVKDSRLLYTSSSPTATVAGDTLTWTFSALELLAEREIQIGLQTQTPPTTDVGDTLKLSAKIEYAQTDATPANNQKQIEQLIVGPYDPNDKHEVHNGSINTLAYAAGEHLNYLINFQNVGSDTAFYVEIRDTLATRLDAKYLEFLHSSHPCIVSITEDRFVAFKFANANLPPKAINEEGSKGYVVFKIKPVRNLVVGDTIKNTASIYFDYNAAVVTNTVATKISACTVATPSVSAAGTTSICQGSSIALSSSASAGNQWYKDGITISGATNQTYTATQAGSYTVITSQNTCVSAVSAAVQVVVNPVPQTPTITQNGSSLLSSAAAGNQWFLNGVALAAAVQQVYVPTSSGSYSVQVTAGGCKSAVSNTINHVVTQIVSPSLPAEITIAPNPVKDKLTIRHNGGSTKMVVSMYDPTGRQKIVKRFTSNISLDMSGMAAGAYTIRIKNERTNEVMVSVVVKQ